MGIRIETRTPDHLDAIRAFNARLAAGGIGKEFLISEEGWTAPVAGLPVTREQMLALDGSEVRGGYLMEWHNFSIGGRIVCMGGYQTPVSEGTVNRRYLAVGVLMLKDALHRNPYLYTVGMGGLELPLPRMLKAMGWYLQLAPFLFRVSRPRRFLRHIGPLRTSTARRAVADVLAYSGLGWAGVRALQWRSVIGGEARLVAEEVDAFGGWADELWERARVEHSLCAVRTAEVLNLLYPAAERRIRRLRLRQHGETVGWILLLVSEYRDNRYFGQMRVGTILDGLVVPRFLAAAVRAAAAALEDAGVDLVVSNQMDSRWVQALRSAGFLRGPSNYGVSFSPAVMEALGPLAERERTIHITRGDGDGRVNL